MLPRILALLCCTVLGTVACSSEERAPVDQGQRVVTRTVTETVAAQGSPATTPETVAPEMTNEPVETAPPETTDSPDLVVGDTAVTAAGNEITVHSFEYVPPAEFFQPEPGFRFAALDVEGCADADSAATAGLNPFDFSLQMPDNTRLESDIAAKEPALNDTTILPGDCVRGFVTFQVPEGQTPTDVVFTASSIIKWSVQEVAAEEQAPEEILALQYEYINLSDYEAAYELFADQSQQIVSLEQYRAFFQPFDFYYLEDYSFPSVQVQGDTATIDVVFTVLTGTGEEQYQRTQQMVREDGGWRIVMRDEQIAAY